MYKSQRDKGLTIAEMLVATGLLAVVLVTVMTLFGKLLQNTNKNSMLSAGAFFADSVLERQIEQARITLDGLTDNADPAFEPAVVEGEDSIATSDEELQTKYIYRVEAIREDEGTTAGQGQMWYVQVEVRWWNDSIEGDSARAGMGNMSVKRGRLVYLPKPEVAP